MSDTPVCAVVIPTYNRSDMLRQTLHSLTRQNMPADRFEVIVSDDGSSDDTAAIAQSFSDKLRLAYHFQEDLGNRAGVARNAGARLASAPVLVFLDAGAIAGPDFLTWHVRAHQGDTPTAVLGYAYGFNPDIEPRPGLAEALATLPPEGVLAAYADDPAFLDCRQGEFDSCDFDVDRRLAPWMLLFTINCSVRADVFWKVGGFDEGFRGWGMEDLELGYRLRRHGAAFQVSREAWVIESPHPRDTGARMAEFRHNAYRLIAQHSDPYVEIGWWLITTDGFWRWERECQALAITTPRVRDHDVSAELAAAVRDLAPGSRTAVLGCGGELPASLPPDVVVFDFDRELLDRALASGRHEGHHAIGLRTCLPDGAVDTVVITSRLRLLWDLWGEGLMAEARRIGREVLRTT